jgi:hypothetical protein
MVKVTRTFIVLVGLEVQDSIFIFVVKIFRLERHFYSYLLHFYSVDLKYISKILQGVGKNNCAG